MASQAIEPMPPLTPSPLPFEDEVFVRENDITSQLPELKKLLAVLREKRVRGCEGNGDCGPGDPELLTRKAVRVIQCLAGSYIHIVMDKITVIMNELVA